MQVRSFGILAIMLSFVAAGTYRGMKDTRTPLVAAACATSAKLLLNVLFIYGEKLHKQLFACHASVAADDNLHTFVGVCCGACMQALQYWLLAFDTETALCHKLAHS